MLKTGIASLEDLISGKNNEHFRLTQHDVLKPFKDRFTFIRAMNVLNPSYFSNDDFPKIIRHMHNGLEDDGLFITGSNQEANTTVNGAIYRKYKEGFSLLWCSGKGSPIHDYITGFSS